MRRMITWAAAVLLALGAADARADRVAAPKPAEEAPCGEFGTSLHFEKSPSEAARKALKDEKLVFVLHISGHFDDTAFT